MLAINTKVRLRSRYESRGEGVIIAQPITAFVVVRWDDGSESTERLDHLRPLEASA